MSGGRDRSRLIVVIEYEYGEDREQALYEAIDQVRKGAKLLNKDHVRVIHVHSAIKGTANTIMNIFKKEEKQDA